MELFELLNRDIVCSCGRVHRCDIDLVADNNTYAICGERVRALLGEKVKEVCLFVTDDKPNIERKYSIIET